MKAVIPTMASMKAPIIIIIKIPLIMEYTVTEIKKLKYSLPWWSMKSDSSFFRSQMISGPIKAVKKLIK